MFRFYPEVAAAVPRTVAYRQPDLTFPLQELCGAITPRTRAILIANPNNPTGAAIGLAEIETILQRAGGVAVMIDEAYFEFYGVTARDLIPRYPNLFVSRTFSKVYGLAALRIGYLMSQAENVKIMRKGQSPYSVNTCAVVCALAALEDQDYVRAYVSEALASREMLYRGLKRLKVPYYRSEANFVLAHFGDCAKEVVRLVREKGILIRDRTHELAGTARITAGKKAHTRQVLAALKEALAECGR
jgi:histidinol-phosphate aminotransferase